MVRPMFTLIVAGALSVATASAQTSTGGLRGFVKDDTGGVLAGVTVEATSPSRIGGAAVEVTDGQGLYRFENLPLGEYTLTFTLQGFGTTRREAMRVEVGRTIQLDMQMKVGNVEQSITVTGESPVVDAVHSGISSNFNQEMLQNIPSSRQSYFDIVTYTPAVRINQVPNDSRFIIFGSSSDQNQFQYDGVDISAVSNGGVWDFPSPDIMQEVQVNAVGASAEFHDFQGGVVNIVTKTRQQQLPRHRQLLHHPAGPGGQQHAERAVPLQDSLQPAGDLRARRPDRRRIARGSTASCRLSAASPPASASIRTWTSRAARATSRLPRARSGSARTTT